MKYRIILYPVNNGYKTKIADFGFTLKIEKTIDECIRKSKKIIKILIKNDVSPIKNKFISNYNISINNQIIIRYITINIHKKELKNQTINYFYNKKTYNTSLVVNAAGIITAATAFLFPVVSSLITNNYGKEESAQLIMKFASDTILFLIYSLWSISIIYGIYKHNKEALIKTFCIIFMSAVVILLPFQILSNKFNNDLEVQDSIKQSKHIKYTQPKMKITRPYFFSIHESYK